MIDFFRELKAKANGVEEHVLLFATLVVIGFGTIAIAWSVVLLAIAFPLVAIPAYAVLCMLWWGYRQL